MSDNCSQNSDDCSDLCSQEQIKGDNPPLREDDA